MPHLETPQSRCRFAIASGDITPPIGIYHRMWGAATHDRAEGIHQPLRAMVAILAPLVDPQPRRILVSLDHCLLGVEEMERLTAQVSRAAQVPASELLVTFTHTHGAGLMSLDRANLPGGELIAPYLDRVAGVVSELVSDAAAKLTPATIVYGTGRCSLAIHRDQWDADSQQWVCGFNPIVPADQTLLAARVTGDDGRVLGTIVNYACHPTTLAWANKLVSPDWPGTMRDVVEQAMAAPCLFLQGASGELGPRDGYVGDVAVAEQNGRQVAHAALSVIESLPPPLTCYEYAGPVVSGATLGQWKHRPLDPAARSRLERFDARDETLPLPYRPDLPTKEQAAAALGRYQSEESGARSRGDVAASRNSRAMVERQTRMIRRLEQLPPGDQYPLRIQLWRMGDAIWLAVSGEHYSFLQTSLRTRFPGVPIVVITLTGGWGPSYIPTRETYGKGIYQESIALVAPGSLEQIVEHVVGRIRELREQRS
ncbi:MAG TPA: neutral/alkaline non-lysosomal ceramidase N-terminal domain-containing protein [Pirellulaceae bacterium]|nr:neutral/alkaline non-lysosomal ceramidase N-terminal domain-containing protein [Pirellulaceae bacterium]